MVSNWLGLPIPNKPLGVHAGLWGLIFNCVIIFAMNKKKFNSRTILV